MKTMAAWHAYFLSQKEVSRVVLWDSLQKDSILQQKMIARSLAHFQLGESGDGRRIRGLALRYAQERGESDYAVAVELFVREENQHAALLAEAVGYLQGSLIQKHWTETVFVLLRRAFTLAFEVQVLAWAEIIGLLYYSFLYERTQDKDIRAMCAIFLTEERQHLCFDADALSWMFSGRTSGRFAFCARILFWGALVAAWIDHAPSLRLFNVSFLSWMRRGRAEYVRFVLRRDTGEEV